MPLASHLIVPLAASHTPSGQSAMATLATPQLDALLARLSPARTDAGEDTDMAPPHERALAHALGLPAARTGGTPWAAWAHRATTDAACAYLTPCQWMVTPDQVMLLDPAMLQLDEADSRALLAIVAPWFEEDGITLTYEAPLRWLAQGALFDGLATASLDRVVQRDVRPWMPDPASARTLHRLHSEMQMLLYTHAFNDAREARGLQPVNAFWVHGSGRLAPSTPAASSAPAPVVIDTLREAALREDWRAWAEAWAVLDAGPIAQLLAAAQRGEAVTLTLCGERSSQTWHTAPRSLLQKVQSIFKPQRFANVREQL